MELKHLLPLIEDGDSEDMLKILEEVVLNNYEVEIHIGTEAFNEKPYIVPIYYLHIGQEVEDESESTIFEPYWFGAGRTLKEAVKDLVKRKFKGQY
jgi:hypothetical protein